ncbi:aminoglycoside 6'-N-acetyltransferase [Pseudomonas nicosulfuronedens]
MDMQVRHCEAGDLTDWVDLRLQLWPGDHTEAFFAEARDILEQSQRFGAWLARDEQGRALGLAEASVRSDYVNGTEGAPVLFLEGIHVRADARRQGVARALVSAVEAWGIARGCVDFASDAVLDNTVSHALHRALGFVETERVVYFRKPIRD